MCVYVWVDCFWGKGARLLMGPHSMAWSVLGTACIDCLLGFVQDGTTALYTACESGATALVRLLLSASARPGVPRRVR